MRIANEKEMQALREDEGAYKQSKMTRLPLRDYSMKHRVEIIWDLNEDAIRERIFKLRIDGIEVLLDAEQVRRRLRWV